MYHHEKILSRQRGQNYPYKYISHNSLREKVFCQRIQFFICMLFCLQEHPAVQSQLTKTSRTHSDLGTYTQYSFSVSIQPASANKKNNNYQPCYIDCLLGLNFNLYGYSRQQDAGWTPEHKLTMTVMIHEWLLFWSDVVWMMVCNRFKLCIILSKCLMQKGPLCVNIDYSPSVWCCYGTLKMEAMRV